MATVYNAIEDSFYDFLSPILAPNAVIISNQAGNEPTSTYLVVDVLTADPVGSVKKSVFAREIGTTDVFETYDYTTYVVSVKFQAIGSKADQVIQRLEQCFSRDVDREVLAHTYKVSFMKANTIRRAPIKRETKFVESYVLNATFSCMLTDTYKTDIIEKVVVNTNIPPIEKFVVDLSTGKITPLG